MTLGLFLPSGGGIFWVKISWINQLKKGGVLGAVSPET